MPAGRPRQYLERYDTTVSVERKLWDIGKNLGITLAEAVSYGLQVLIEAELRYQPELSSDDLNQYLELKRSELLANKKAVSRQESAEKTVQTLIELKHEEEKRSEALTKPIRVWNEADRRYETIPVNQFNPDFHRRVRE